jgi:hypothetical protein
MNPVEKKKRLFCVNKQNVCKLDEKAKDPQVNS